MPPKLTPDCEKCAGLCCVAPAFSASPEFAVDKGAGLACPHLTTGLRCEIHDQLAERGFPGCVAYDCYGSGQQVTQVTFGGRNWQDEPAIATRMFDVFMVMRRLHELLMYLNEARKLTAARSLYGEIESEAQRISALTHERADALLALDVSAEKQAVNELLLRVGDLVRLARPV